MSRRSDSDHPDNLIAELPLWNNGDGVDAEDWIGMMGNYELAVGYSLIFWPQFRVVGDCVLRGDPDEPVRGDPPRLSLAERRRNEALHNHVHMVDIHCNVQGTEAQLRYLGRTLKSIHETKLKADFPARRFIVDFNDEPGLELLDYQLTFWQATDEG